MMMDLRDDVSFRDIWAIYQTVWGEARGETYQGKLAVANVILNRVRDPRWPDTAYRVCHDKWQFSAWNENNPNRKKMQRLRADDLNEECMEATLYAVASDDDPTKGATHYFAQYIDTPRWAKEMVETTRIGTHRFFK